MAALAAATAVATESACSFGGEGASEETLVDADSLSSELPDGGSLV